MSRRLVTAVCIALAACAAARAAEDNASFLPQPPAPPARTPEDADAPAPPPPQDAATYDEREASFPQNRPVTVESLALPPAKFADRTPPAKVLPGHRPQDVLPGRPSEHIWAVVPLVPAHSTFIERFSAAAGDDARLALLAWCRENRLPECAEFTARHILFTRWGQLSDPAYRQALAAWLPLAERRGAPPYVFDLPVRGPWTVEKGTAEVHRRNHSSAFTQNLIIEVGGKRFKSTGKTPEDFYAWGQPFHAVGDGRIAKVDDQHPDPPVGRAGDWRVANLIIQDLGGGVHVHYGHIRQGSAKVKEGDTVTRGQALGEVGNSGSDGRPHLHFTMLDSDYFSVPGRFRYEQLTPRGWAPRDGAALEEGAVIRHPAADAQPEKPATPQPPRPRRPAR
jgi:murein DD-endopeptidase MepM/ murein hydrolase activator NlpD